jgi:protein TonB
VKIHKPHPVPQGTVAGLVGTIVVHAGAVFFLVAAVKPARPSPPSYAVDLVAAPAPTKRRLAREALPTPPPEEKPAPKPPPVESEREPAPPTATPVAPAPGETPSTGTDVATIKTPGLAFPYPEYLRNIVTQVYQRWDRASAKQSNFAEISFLILRDGSVRDIRFVTRSGSFAFDIDAQGAIEAAGNSRAFGQLPDGWEADVLPVSFYFKPSR